MLRVLQATRAEAVQSNSNPEPSNDVGRSRGRVGFHVAQASGQSAVCVGKVEVVVVAAAADGMGDRSATLGTQDKTRRHGLRGLE